MRFGQSIGAGKNWDFDYEEYIQGLEAGEFNKESAAVMGYV